MPVPLPFTIQFFSIVYAIKLLPPFRKLVQSRVKPFRWFRSISFTTIAGLKAGEQLHTDAVITPYSDTVKALIQDVLPVCGAFHYGFMNIGRSIIAFGSV